MKFLSNLHTHTLYCDGKNTPEEYIQKAIEKGFISIGFSGHSYLDFGEDWFMGTNETKEYIKEIRELKEKYKKVIAMGDKGGLIIEDSNIREFGDVYTYSK